MTLVETYLPFGIRDVKITPFIGELGVGTPVDLPVGRVVTFRETENVELLKSDDRNVAMEGTGAMVEWELEAGGISFEAWQILTGASLISGSGFRELVKLDTDVRPYFVIEGQSINDDGSDIHVLIRRCKVNGTVEGTFSEGEFFLTRCEGLGIGDSTGELWRMRWNAAPTEVFGGVRALPNTIHILARPLTISTGNVVAGTLVPATTTLQAQPLAVTLGFAVAIALQPRLIQMSAQPLSVSGGVGALTLAPRTLAVTAVPLTVSRGINLQPAVVNLSSRPLSLSGTSVTIEAEAGSVEGNAVVSTDYPGYTGTGYIGFFGLTGDVNQIIANIATGGTYPFSIRFGQGDPPNSPTIVNIRVNGSIQGTISLPNTATSWESAARFTQSTTINIPLNSGNNTIRIEHAGLEYTYADLDSYTIGNASGGGGDPGLPPVAEFTITPSSAQVGQTVQFNDQSTNVPTGWSWDFGDASTDSFLQHPTHVYTGAASYDVLLTASNAAGQHSRFHNIVITSGGGGGTPDYVVGVNGSLSQILNLSTSQLAGRLVLIPSGLWNDDNWYLNKDFGGVRVEWAAGAILRNPGGSGMEFYGACKNITLFGPGVVEAAGSNTNAEGIYGDGSRSNRGGSTSGPSGNIVVDGLTVRPIPGTGKIGRNGIAFWNGDNFVVRNCIIRDASGNAAYGFGGAGSGISIGRSWAGVGGGLGGFRILLENNQVYNQIQDDGNPSADRNGIIIDLWHSDGNGLYSNRSVGPIMIRNNLVENVSGRGIQILRSSWSDSPVSILSNTVRPAWANFLGPSPDDGHFSEPLTAIGGYGWMGSFGGGSVTCSFNTVIDDPSNGLPAYKFVSFHTSPGVTGQGNVGSGVVFDGSPGSSPPPGFMA